MSLVTTPKPGSLGIADLEAMPDNGHRYAAAGIPAYWLIDLPAEVITTLALTDTGLYQTVAEGPTVTVTTPLPVTLDLEQLTHRPGRAPQQ